MTPLYQWATEYGITPQALTALLHVLGAAAPEMPVGGSGPAGSEAALQQQVRLEAARRGTWVMRNNSGACEDKTGRMIRYGLANESSQMNEQIKSSDLIGITPITCQCGWRHGVFTALEVKKPGWHITPGDKRAQAQLRFIQKVVSMGGIGRFITRVEDMS